MVTGGGPWAIGCVARLRVPTPYKRQSRDQTDQSVPLTTPSTQTELPDQTAHKRMSPPASVTTLRKCYSSVRIIHEKPED